MSTHTQYLSNKSNDDLKRSTSGTLLEFARGNLKLIIDKQDIEMKGIHFKTLDDFKPLEREDAEVLFREIDIDGGGTLTMDEVFYWLVNQMVGLQYNYRTQINKHLRKAFKMVDKKSKGSLTVTEFYLLMQFIG